MMSFRQAFTCRMSSICVMDAGMRDADGVLRNSSLRESFKRTRSLKPSRDICLTVRKTKGKMALSTRGQTLSEGRLTWGFGSIPVTLQSAFVETFRNPGQDLPTILYLKTK
ncbi:hypothetical protein DNTS_014115, partial [Danionella cerebrum]